MADSSLLKRVIGAALLVVVLIGSLLLHPLAYALVFTLGLCVMMDEFYRMSLGRGTHLFSRALMILLCSGFYLAFVLFRLYRFDGKYLLIALPVLMLVLISILMDRQQRIERLTAQDICFPAVYLLPSFSVTSLLLIDGSGSYNPNLFIAVMLMVWMSDVGAYAIGMLFGQKEKCRKLSPDISPNKSWAGVAGCILFTIITAIVIHITGLFELRLWHWLVAGAIVVVFGIMGDLFESLIKRHYGVKDAGSILIGHGGLLDRFDGALFSIPVVTVFFILAGVI